MAEYDLSPGQMAGEYRIERKIGEGGFGKVYAAVHPVIGKAAAVKILNPDLAKNQEMVQRFVDEARAVNQIRHRNIIDIFAFGTLPNGLHYFVMELLEGMSLDSYLEKHAPLEPGHALAILWPVGRALVAAHKAGVAHRDLKPENVFLTFDQDGGIFPKLLDFGIAKLLNESEMVHRTRTGVMMGTPLYMSPEQCRGSGVDHRSDIYSFGIMTHEVLTGGKPFMAETMMDLIIKQIGEPPPPMSARRPDLPRSLDAAVLHMLEKAADRRPASMQAALDELMAAARAGGIEIPSSIQTPAHSPQPPRTAPAQPPAPTAGQPHVDTGAWLQQSGPPTGPAAGHTAPGQPPVAAHTPAPTAAGTSGATPAPAPAGPGAGYAQTPGGPAGHGGYPPGQGAGGYPPGQAAAGYPHGQAAAGYPHGQGAGHPPAYAAPTLQSAGHLPPQPLHAPPRKSASPLGVFAALGAILFFLFVAGFIGFAILWGTDDTVEIGSSLPAQGTFVDRDTTVDFVMKLTAPGEGAPRFTIQQKTHRWQRLTVRAVDAERVTRVDVQYGDHTETTTTNEGSHSQPVVPANRTFVATARGADIEVTSADGQPVTEQELDEVVDDAGPLFHPLTDVFNQPLSAGDTVRVPSDTMLELLGFRTPQPGTTMRADNATLKLLTIDPGGEKATFEVSFLFVEDGTSPPLHAQGPLKGTFTMDTRSGMPLKGGLSGPLEGSLTESGTVLSLSGSMNIDSR